jgi:hypothetical protein
MKLMVVLSAMAISWRLNLHFMPLIAAAQHIPGQRSLLSIETLRLVFSLASDRQTGTLSATVDTKKPGTCLYLKSSNDGMFSG